MKKDTIVLLSSMLVITVCVVLKPVDQVDRSIALGRLPNPKIIVHSEKQDQNQNTHQKKKLDLHHHHHSRKKSNSRKNSNPVLNNRNRQNNKFQVNSRRFSQSAANMNRSPKSNMTNKFKQFTQNALRNKNSQQVSKSHHIQQERKNKSWVQYLKVCYMLLYIMFSQIKAFFHLMTIVQSKFQELVTHKYPQILAKMKQSAMKKYQQIKEKTQFLQVNQNSKQKQLSQLLEKINDTIRSCHQIVQEKIVVKLVHGQTVTVTEHHQTSAFQKLYEQLNGWKQDSRHKKDAKQANSLWLKIIKFMFLFSGKMQNDVRIIYEKLALGDPPQIKNSLQNEQLCKQIQEGQRELQIVFGKVLSNLSTKYGQMQTFGDSMQQIFSQNPMVSQENRQLLVRWKQNLVRDRHLMSQVLQNKNMLMATHSTIADN